MKASEKIKKIVLLSFGSMLTTIILSSCIFGITGKGDVVTEIIELDAIEGLDLAIEADIELNYGETQTVEISAQKNIIDNIKRDIRSGTWQIKFKRNASNFDPILISITVPEIKDVSISGTGEVFFNDEFETDFLELGISGSGIIDGLIICNKTKISIPGSGDIYLSGTADEQDISVSGSGNYSGFGLECGDCDISIPGSGYCEVFVNDNLYVKISGSGNVYYRGMPSILHEISGSGRIINDN